MTLLFRPVGLHELRLVAEARWRAFPPRLPGQPIFYPVLDEAYAEQIARAWNPVDEASGFAGFVTAFAVDAAFAAHYPVQVVGASHHRELWVPAEDLPEFNRQLIGPIEVRSAHYGARFAGDVDAQTRLPSALAKLALRLTCGKCGCGLPYLGVFDAALRREVREMLRERGGLEAIKLLHGATASIVDAKAVVTHLVREAGRCHRCRGPIPGAPICECPRCRSLNLTW